MLVDPVHVSLADLEAIYDGASIELHSDCRTRVEQSASYVAIAAQVEKPSYGINTGFGKLASTRIPLDQVEQLQHNLILSHCAGVGDDLPTKVVRLIVILKIMSLARGASGVRWVLIEHLQRLIESDVIPCIPSKGSVGASGDLAPLAHLTATLLGKNCAYHRGKLISGGEALKIAGLVPLKLAPKEGLAMINGTQVSTALALSGMFDAWTNALCSITTGALSVDAAMASSEPFRAEINELRGHECQILVGKVLHKLLQDSEIRESHREDDVRVQDPYCLRCQPQVLGATLTSLRQAGEVLGIEASAVTDNPIVLPDGRIISGGNFHGEPVGIAADQIAIAIAEIGSISQRRISLLVDPANSFGLPAFLTPNPGLNSGFMVPEIVSAALASENKSLSNPRVVDSTPTSAMQEDHVAMSCHGARRLLEMNQNLSDLIAIEALCAAQGIDLRKPLRTSHALQDMHARIRKLSAMLDQDRILRDEIRNVSNLVKSGALIPAMKINIDAKKS